MAKVFLTGSKGFIGWWLHKALIDGGHFVETDMRNFDRYYDRVIHLAAVTNISSEFIPEIFESNILFAKKIMTTPNKLIYASSCSAAHMTNPYAYTKKFAEHLGSIHGSAIGLRFHNVYGPNNNKGIVKFLLDQPDGATITIRGPELIRDYVFVTDVVSLICEYVEHDFVPGVVEVGTGIGTQTIDLVNMFMHLSGKKFVLKFGQHGNNEPQRMVAAMSINNFISLEEGLKKTIDHEEI